jgi:hypothetical protein
MIEEPNELADREHDFVKQLNEATFTARGYKEIISMLASDLEAILNVLEPKFGALNYHRDTIRKARELIK